MGNREKLSQDKGFNCISCGKKVSNLGFFGSSHRNHCPFCGYSKHVDLAKGDRASKCNGKMEPVGLMYKSHNELCIVHRCLSCGKLNHNRIASDDKPDMIEALLNKPKLLEPETQLILDNSGVKLLDSRDKMSVHIQLYGKP